MKRPKNGSTLKQSAYAKRVWGAQGESKKAIALAVGYSPAVAHSVSQKIEKTEGFHNAMAVLASESNNAAMEIMAEYKARGFKDFSNKDLNGALNAIASAWAKFNRQDGDTPKDSPLRTIIQQRVAKQTINVTQSGKGNVK